MAKSKNCPSCGLKFGLFRWRQHCVKCGNDYCSDCITKIDRLEYYCCEFPHSSDSFLCNSCWDGALSTLVKKYTIALDQFESVESYSSNYKGKIPVRNDESLELDSTWFRDRDDVDKQLKVTAHVNDFDVLYNYTYEKGTGSENAHNPSGKGRTGTHYYTIWKGSCTAGRRV